MSLKPNQRRPAFDDLTIGWGSDKLDDLQARAELLKDLFMDLSGFTAAEQKISDAINRRIAELEVTP